MTTFEREYGSGEHIRSVPQFARLSAVCAI